MPENHETQPPPLSGIRILDLSNTLMGPYCSRTLADLGAEVLKVEPIEGDITRNVGDSRNPGMGPVFLATNHSKRSIALNLKVEQGREALLRLAQTADVLIHNFRPDAVERLKLDTESVRALNPRLVYCAVVGFGSEGPYRNRAAYDDVIQAVSGLAAVQSGKSGQSYVRTAVADKTVGLVAATAIVAALLRRTATGSGDAIEVPMFETMASFTLVEQQGGLVFDPPVGNHGYARTASEFRRPYRTADGLMAVMVYTDRQWQSFFELIGRAELCDDPRFCTIKERTENIDILYQLVETSLPDRNTSEWEDKFSELGIPATRVLDIPDLLEDPHLHQVNFFVDVDHPTEGRLREPRNPVTFADTELDTPRPAPRLGEHTRELLSEVGFSDRQIDTLVAGGVALDSA